MLQVNIYDIYYIYIYIYDVCVKMFINNFKNPSTQGNSPGICENHTRPLHELIHIYDIYMIYV